MLDLLKGIHSPEDIKALDEKELIKLSSEIRSFLIQSLSQTGGHLASNLGIVELTVALHYIFNLPEDKIIWDVGHQAYVHKLLTGRRKDFKTLRQFNGLSGFPKRCESPYDVFDTGHSSTSISAALGIAKARDLKGEDYKVIAVIGDGALTGGMAFEALNHAGRGSTNLIVIVNDNEMSISKNVGGLGKYLNHLRSSKDYLKAKEDIEGVLHKVPVVGEHMVNTVRRTKESVKSFMMPNTLFEQLGFTYLGPVNGHNYQELIDILENAKNMKGPILIHVKTKKGKGYKKAELNPSQYHGVGPFCIETGLAPLKTDAPLTFSTAFGKAMVLLAEEEERLVGITAAMPDGTGLIPFAKAHHRRFFDVGIAEQHAVTFAAGLSAAGYKPVVAVYSSFLQRAYDQILHDVCLQGLDVIFAIDRAGVVGEDGVTHHGLYDIAFLSSMPHMCILAPKSPEEIEAAMRYALKHKGPVAIRYPKGTTQICKQMLNEYNSTSFRTLKEGSTVAILAIGKMVETALEVNELLAKQGIKVAIIEPPCVCPINLEEIRAIGDTYDYLFTLEDGILKGGFGENIAATLMEMGSAIRVTTLGYKSGIVPHGKVSELYALEGLDAEGVKQSLLKVLEKESK